VNYQRLAFVEFASSDAKSGHLRMPYSSSVKFINDLDGNFYVIISAHMQDDPLQPHAHEPNPEPPSADSTFILALPDGREEAITIQFLDTFPLTFLPDSYIVSTGHGTSGPFNFGGIPLRSLLTHPAGLFPNYDHVEVISADGFGTRIYRSELKKGDGLSRPVLLAWILDGLPMSREQGAVRLVVPTETDDALRQVKWIGRINIRP
jgi:hypothetical protein